MDIVDLENEHADLNHWLNKLTVFLNEQKEKQTVNDCQLKLLYQQYVYMQSYMNILNHRIKDLDLERGL